MAQKKWKLSRLYAALETTFGTDPDSDGSDYKFLKALPDMTFQPQVDVVERPGLMNDLTRLPHVMGAKAGQLNFKLEVKGSGTPGTGLCVAAEADPILEALFGTVSHGTGSTINGVATTTSLPMTSAAGFSKYMMVIVNCGATYGYVPRFITSISGSDLTLDRALPAAPANGAAVHATTKYTRANTAHKSLAFAAYRDDVLYTFLGCKIDSAKVSGITARGTAILDVTCSVSDWNSTAKGSIPTPMAAAINTVNAPVVKASCFAVGGTEEHCYSLELDFGHQFQFVDSTCALGPAQPESANAGLELVDAAPTGSVKAYYQSAHMTDFAAGTERSFAFHSGAGAGNAWGFYVPKAQLSQPQFEDHNGMVGESFNFHVNENSSDPEYSFCLA